MHQHACCLHTCGKHGYCSTRALIIQMMNMHAHNQSHNVYSGFLQHLDEFKHWTRVRENNERAARFTYRTFPLLCWFELWIVTRRLVSIFVNIDSIKSQFRHVYSLYHFSKEQLVAENSHSHTHTHKKSKCCLFCFLSVMKLNYSFWLIAIYLSSTGYSMTRVHINSTTTFNAIELQKHSNNSAQLGSFYGFVNKTISHEIARK